MPAQQFGSAQVTVQAQTPVQSALTAINAGSTAFVSIQCFDSNDLPLTPQSLRWRLDNLTVGTVVQNWEGFTGTLGPVSQLVIAASLNQLSSASTDSEYFQVTLQITDTMNPANVENVTAEYVVLGIS